MLLNDNSSMTSIVVRIRAEHVSLMVQPRLNSKDWLCQIPSCCTDFVWKFKIYSQSCVQIGTKTAGACFLRHAAEVHMCLQQLS